MARDSGWYKQRRVGRSRRDGRVFNRSFFNGYAGIRPQSIDILITSPPYLNNYHYNRNTRPHLYWLGFCSRPDDMKHLEEMNFGTYWQNARGEDRVDLDGSIRDREIRDTIDDVRSRNPDRGPYGGNGWANYAARYFNDCSRFMTGVRWCLCSGATALVVIGNSILQGVPVPTDRFLARIAEERHLDVIGIHRPRAARTGNSIVDSAVRAGKADVPTTLYESVVEIRRP